MASNLSRIGFANTFDNALRNLQTRQASLSGLQENLTSGKKVVRASDDPTFELRELAPSTHAVRYVIRYIEPLAENLPARGLDVGSEPLRRLLQEMDPEAAEKAGMLAAIIGPESAQAGLAARLAAEAAAFDFDAAQASLAQLREELP